MSRREIFTSATAIAVPAVALATTAMLPAVAAAANPDAELISLNDEHSRALVELEAYVDGLGSEDIPDEYQFPDEEIALRMTAIQAMTIKGLAIKTKAYLHSDAIIDRKNRDIPDPKADWSVSEKLLYSILSDIIALGGVETHVWPGKEG